MLEGLKILGVTLARGGSKSVPRKNIKHIAGAPLLSYTITEALKSKFLTRYIVSTDDDEIRKVALDYGAEVPFLRPPELSADESTSVSALQHAVSWVESDEGMQYDYIIEIMCTNPLKNSTDIDGCLLKLVKTGADSVIAVNQLEDHHPARIKKIEDDRLVNFCVPEIPESRRQDLSPKAFIRSGSIYAMRRNHLICDGLRYGSRESRPYILPPERVINIDTSTDFLVAEYLLRRLMDER